MCMKNIRCILRVAYHARVVYISNNTSPTLNGLALQGAFTCRDSRWRKAARLRLGQLRDWVRWTRASSGSASAPEWPRIESMHFINSTWDTTIALSNDKLQLLPPLRFHSWVPHTATTDIYIFVSCSRQTSPSTTLQCVEVAPRNETGTTPWTVL